jgi:hypothetical protein
MLPPFSFIKPASSAFSIASLNLTGYWPDGNYQSLPSGVWAGAASAGASGGRDLTEATNYPAKIGAGGGYPDFDGTNDRLATALTLDDFFNASAWSAWVLFWADTAAADGGGGNRYANAQFFGDAANAVLAVGFSTSGVHVVGGAAGATDALVVACGTGAWHLAQVKYDGTNLKLRVDSSLWSSLAAANTSGTYMTNAVKFGANYNNTKFFDGKIRNMGFTDSALSDATFDSIKAALNTAYGLSL